MNVYRVNNEIVVMLQLDESKVLPREDGDIDLVLTKQQAIELAKKLNMSAQSDTTPIN